MRLTLLDFVTQTRSRYLKESCKDIDTVRNMNIIARSELYVTEGVRRCMKYQREYK